MPDRMSWEKTETWERVIASILASGVKLDLKAIAKYYGTTYDTLENRFRKIKKDAAVLKDEVDSGQREEVKSAPITPRKPKTPKKEALNSVTNGRVAKSTPTSKKKNAVKREASEDDIFDDFVHNNVGAFDAATLGFGGDDLFNGMN